jgi:acetylornithine deacetylase/succinyl-diaminopimelate desuccinylase-like protein
MSDEFPIPRDTAEDEPMNAVATKIESDQATHLDLLQELLRIPSVSTDDDRKDDVQKAGEWVRDRLAAAGCTTVELHPTAGHPIVYGEWLGATGAPTILVYGHYDVQPVDPIDLWETPPFEPTLRDGKLFARGASDDKGQFLVHILALEAHLAATGTCPVNVKFLIEGEEEIGSPNLSPFLDANRDKLACDVVVVSDTAMFAPDQPSICYGLRGLAYLEVTVRGTSRDLHSGVYGGAVVNPAIALATMLASMKDAKGRITVPGFYDRVRKPSARERKSLGRLVHSDKKFRTAIGAPELTGEQGFSTLERTWSRPSFDINGIWAGFTGKGAKTVIPAVAHAKISMRLVPDQDPDAIARKVAAHLRKIAPKTVTVDVRDLHGGHPWVAPTDHPALQAAGRALERAFRKKPVFTREGGSIPIVADFDRILKVPTVLMGLGLTDDNLHAPNEKFDVANFHRGVTASAFLMEELGAPGALANGTSRSSRKAGGRKRSKAAKPARKSRGKKKNAGARADQRARAKTRTKTARKKPARRKPARR